MGRPEKFQAFRIQIRKQKTVSVAVLETKGIIEKSKFRFSRQRVSRQWLRRGGRVHRSFQRVSGGFIQQQERQRIYKNMEDEKQIFLPETVETTVAEGRQSSQELSTVHLREEN